MIACFLLRAQAGESGVGAGTLEAPSLEVAATCDPGRPLTPNERVELVAKLHESATGDRLLKDYEREFGSFANLLIQWDSVSYSQVVSVRHQRSSVNASGGRAPAGVSALGNGVCIHLTRKLPDIEHVADLAHELTHATRLSAAVLRGDVDTVGEFVRARLAARGGEADAFSVECRVKFELLGHWDEFCQPYADGDTSGFDAKQVLRDLYTGKLSASLTGETYPVMLSRQFRALAAKRVAKVGRVSYASSPYGRQ